MWHWKGCGVGVLCVPAMGPECVPGGKVSAGLGLGRTASAVQLQGAAPRPFCTALSISTGTEQCMVMQFGGLHLNLAR